MPTSTIGRGIQVLEPLPNQSLTGPRISLSAGTCFGDTRPSALGRYSANAIIPRLPWREPSDAENGLLHDGSPFAGEWIRVVSVPDTLLQPFKGLRDAALQNKSEAEIIELSRSIECSTGIGQLLADLELRHAQPRYNGAGISTKPSGLLTCTINQNTNSYIGLHVDTFYSKDLDKRSASPSRICINLGCEDRSLLFINLPLQMMARLLEEAGCEDPQRHEAGRGLTIAFLTSFPDYPVTRLRIAPGEAYLAPTENMVHDGSTDGSCHVDITLTVLGHFETDTYTKPADAVELLTNSATATPRRRDPGGPHE